MVELKPKSAVLSRSCLSPPHLAHGLQKFSVPVYHIKHYAVNGITPTNPYSPADLLSGIEIRMRRAADALVSEQSSGLRVFLFGSGSPISSAVLQHNAMAQQIIDVALAALRKDKQAMSGIMAIQQADVLDATGAELALRTLEDRLGKHHAWTVVQQAMRLGTDQISQNSSAVPHSGRGVSYSEPDFAPAVVPASDEDLQPFVDRITYRSSGDGLCLHDDHSFRAACHDLIRMPDAVLVRLIADFMQAAAAKDCSVLIALSPSNLQEADVVVNQQGWSYDIKVIDVGEKGLDKVSKWTGIDRDQLDAIHRFKSDEK